MRDVESDRVGPMLNPPHLGELIRESMDDVGWNVTETASRLGCERRNTVSPSERQSEDIRQHGTGAGRHRLEYCRSLDAFTGKLRACAGTP